MRCITVVHLRDDMVELCSLIADGGYSCALTCANHTVDLSAQNCGNCTATLDTFAGCEPFIVFIFVGGHESGIKHKNVCIGPEKGLSRNECTTVLSLRRPPCSGHVAAIKIAETGCVAAMKNVKLV
jgi:hypothetical protein